MNKAFLFKKKLPLILQDERAECGHACIAMVCNYLGQKLDLFTLRKISPPSSKGINLLQMKQLFENLFCRTRALKITLNDLKYIKFPAILHWNMNHFVVLKKITRRHVVIHDPALGIRRCSYEEVSKSFTGIALEVSRDHPSEFHKISSKKLTLYDLVKTVHGINPTVLFLILLSLSIEILSLLNPLFMQYVTDDVISSSDKTNLYVIASGFVILISIQIFLDYIRGYMIIYFTNNLTEQFASNVVKHILKLPLAFFEKRHTGDIQSKFQAIDQIQKKISTDFVNAVLDGFFILVNIGVMMLYSLSLSLFVIFTLSIYLFIRYSSYYFLRKQAESSISEHARASSAFLETLHAIVPIKCFLKEEVRFNLWKNCYINSLNADIKISRMQVCYNTLNQWLFHIEHIIVVCCGATLVITNKLSVGMLIAFLSYRLLLVNRASSFIQNVFDYKLISIQLNRLSDILFHETELINIGPKRDKIEGALRLKNIYFKYYPTENFILKNINLSINPGEKVAITGSSGCGKTTFLKVLMGLLHSTTGEIYIDNKPLHEFGLKNYRQLTASVMQEDTLLSGSIMDNIAFFEEEIDVERVYEVAKWCYIHEEISHFPMGYETLVGDMGSTLSGGQKQRILLARALYKKPKILFLDEATSHLDSANEKNINRSLKTLQITQIIIAHRQETIQMADRIINLEEIMSD